MNKKNERYQDLDYLTALGATAICHRACREVDAVVDALGRKYEHIDILERHEDIAHVQLKLGQHKVVDWFSIYEDWERFETGIEVAVLALMLGDRYENGRRDGWAECLSCADEGCEKCNMLGSVPADMIATCPACGGEGSTPKDGTCVHCYDGLCWEVERYDILDTAKGWDDTEATERSLKGEI